MRKRKHTHHYIPLNEEMDNTIMLVEKLAIFMGLLVAGAAAIVIFI